MKALLAALAFALPLAAAAAMPTEIASEYQLTTLGGVKIARVTETFSRQGDRYAIQSVTRSEGPLKVFLDDTLTVESAGVVDAGGLKPMRFAQKRARDSRRDIDATFDWERGVLVSTVGGERHEAPLARETQDRLSFLYQFMNLAPREGQWVVSMSNGRKVERYTYRLVDRVRVATPAGEFETLHYERVPDAPGESSAEVWVAPERFNMPVRIVFNDHKGLRLEQTLVALRSR